MHSNHIKKFYRANKENMVKCYCVQLSYDSADWYFLVKDSNKVKGIDIFNEMVDFSHIPYIYEYREDMDAILKQIGVNYHE